MSISHPNIANTQDSGEEDGIGWIIMELVDGYPLTDYLRGGTRIEPEYLLPILVQVAMALGAAARAGRRAPRHQAGEHPRSPGRQW